MSNAFQRFERVNKLFNIDFEGSIGATERSADKMACAWTFSKAQSEDREKRLSQVYLPLSNGFQRNFC